MRDTNRRYNNNGFGIGKHPIKYCWLLLVGPANGATLTAAVVYSERSLLIQSIYNETTMKKIAFTVIILQTLFSAYALAGTTASTLIVMLGIDDGAPNVLFIRVDKTKDNQAGCQSNGTWAYVRPLVSEQDKKIYAMLLAAKASQAPVTLAGTTNCTVYPGIETLQAVYY